jgi:ParB-like chromosome segregation protein Spo0J
MNSKTYKPGHHEIPIKYIRDDDPYVLDNREHLDTMIKDIALNGLVSAIVVTTDLKVIDGYYRLEAVRRLKHKTILCNVTDMTTEQYEILKSLRYVQASKEDIGNALKKLLTSGYTEEQIALRTNKSISEIKRYLEYATI